MRQVRGQCGRDSCPDAERRSPSEAKLVRCAAPQSRDTRHSKMRWTPDLQRTTSCCAASGNGASGKICRDGSYCREDLGREPAAKSPVLLAFWNGTAFAGHGVELKGRAVRRCWSFVMLLALGAASSAIDLLKSLTSSKSQSAGNKQEPKSPFDLSGSAPPARKARRPSPERWQLADIAGDHERAAGGAKPVLDGIDRIGVHQPLGRAEGPVRADRCRQRRQDQQIGIRERARRRRHQPEAGRQRVRQARQGRRRLGQPRRNDVGAEGQGASSP